MTDEPREIRIETPEGEVTASKSKVESFPQQIVVVQGDELKVLQSFGVDGPDFVAHYLPRVTEPELKDYDAAFRAWQLDPNPPYNEQQVIQIVGGYLGNRFVADLEMEWVVVEDEFGIDLAVRGQKLETMSFPFAAVANRIEDNTYDFVHGVYYTVKHLLESGEYAERKP